MVGIKVLICGDYDTFSLSMIKSLKKENNEIYVISGKKNTSRKKSFDVFQEYHFPFTSNSVEFIVSNVKPDAVVFLGSMDAGYTWKDEKEEAVNYMSGLLNLLLVSKSAGVKKFIYFSSYSVFEGNSEREIKEDTSPVPITIRSKTYLQGEKTCLLYREEDEFNISIIRCAQVYGNYENLLLDHNIVYQLLFDKDFYIDMNRKYHLVFLNDVLDGFYRVLNNENVHPSIFHIGAGKVVTAADLLDVLRPFMEKQLNNEEMISTGTSPITDNRSITSESMNLLGYQAKYNLEEGIKRMESAILFHKKKEDKYVTNTKRRRLETIGQNKLIPYIESFVLFLLLQLFLSFTSEMAFHETIDIYLWYTVLIVIVHGSAQAKVAIVLSILGKYYLNPVMDNYNIFAFDYKSYLWILQIITISMFVSYGRDKYKRMAEELSDENRFLQKEIEEIKNINQCNVEAKNIFEKRLVNYKYSLGRIYEIISKMDSLESQKIIFEGIGVIAEIMNTEDVAIYTCETRGNFCRLLAASSDKAKRMGKSIVLKDLGDMGDSLKEGRIYRNAGLNPEFPIMAGATYKNDKMEYVIMIWSLEFEDINLYQTNVFSIICRLIEHSMSKAYTYMESIQETSYIENTRTMNEIAFTKVLEIYDYGKQKTMLEYTLLQVESALTKEKELYHVLDQLIRDTDYMGIGKDGRLYILLTNSDLKDAIQVKNRLEKSGIQIGIVGQ